MSEALMIALTNPQCDKRLFIKLPVEYFSVPNRCVEQSKCAGVKILEKH